MLHVFYKIVKTGLDLPIKDISLRYSVWLKGADSVYGQRVVFSVQLN